MKVTGFKKTLRAAFALLAGVLCFGAFGGLSAAKPTEQPTAAKAETETIFRFEIEVPEEYMAGGEKEWSEFFFTINLNKTEWREVTNLTTESKLEYEVYSPNALTGVGFFSVQDQTQWKFLSNYFEYTYANEAVQKEGGMTDSNGVSVWSGADLSDYITDGWYKRSITMSEIPSSKVCHAVIGVHKPASKLWHKENFVDGNKIVVYYKNIYFDVNGTKVSPIAPSIKPEDGISIENFTDQQRNNNLGYATTGYCGWTISPFADGSTDSNKILKNTFKLSGEAPVFPEVEQTNPLLSTKAQTNAAGTALRFVAAVDSLNYQSVGFEIKIGDKVKTVSSKTVYTSIFAGGTEVFPAVFGENAQYMFTYTIWDIPAEQAATTIQVRAFWTTMDGAVEYGAARTFSVSAVQAAQ